MSNRPSRVPHKPSWVSPVAAGTEGPEGHPRSPTASPPNCTDRNPWPGQTPHQSHSSWPEAAGTGSPERTSPPPGTAWRPCHSAGPGRSGHTWRPAWRGPTGRSTVRQTKRRGCRSGSGRVFDAWRGPSTGGPVAGPTTELRKDGLVLVFSPRNIQKTHLQYNGASTTIKAVVDLIYRCVHTPDINIVRRHMYLKCTTDPEATAACRNMHERVGLHERYVLAKSGW